MHRSRFLVAAALVPAFLFAPIGLVRAQAELHVPADRPTIQAAIDAAGPGDQVVVAPGIYNEAINLLDKQVHVRSSHGPKLTILDGTGLDQSVITFASGEPSRTVIRGFTIRNGTGTLVEEVVVGFGGGTFPNVRAGGGMLIRGNPSVIDCIFKDNSADFGGAVAVLGGSVLFDHCNLLRNAATQRGGGYFGGDGTFLTVFDSEYCSNTPENMWAFIAFIFSGPGGPFPEVCPTPADLVEDLQECVDLLELQLGIRTSLSSMLAEARRALDRGDHRSAVAARLVLMAFANAVRAESNVHIPGGAADVLVDHAGELIEMLEGS